MFRSRRMVAACAEHPVVDLSLPAAPTGLTMVGSINAVEWATLEQECEQLYQHFNDKDEEINQQSLYVDKLKEQILDQEELTANTKKDYENLQAEMTRIQQENESAKEEVKEVLQALELNWIHRNTRPRLKFCSRISS